MPLDAHPLSIETRAGRDWLVMPDGVAFAPDEAAERPAGKLSLRGEHRGVKVDAAARCVMESIVELDVVIGERVESITQVIAAGAAIALCGGVSASPGQAVHARLLIAGHLAAEAREVAR